MLLNTMGYVMCVIRTLKIRIYSEEELSFKASNSSKIQRSNGEPDF